MEMIADTVYVELYQTDPWLVLSLWSILWILMLVLPPGTTSKYSLYRLNFVHGIICCSVATLAIYDFIPEHIATMSSTAYFIVDFINMIINDFVFKVESYQKPAQRRIEYLHHILCGGVAIVSHIPSIVGLCSFEHKGAQRNPFLFLMYAEFSTPSLMLWRYYDEKYTGSLLSVILFIKFYIAFILCRILYHAFIFVPECIEKCDKTLAYAIGIPYNLMNFAFLYFVSNKLKSLLFPKEEKKDENKEEIKDAKKKDVKKMGSETKKVK
jgi:hypothetical protein